MRLKYRVQTFTNLIAFAFYPATTLLSILFVVVVIDVVLGLLMVYKTQSSTAYDIMFALMTGATASAFVSIVIELSNNYKNNKLAWYELGEFYLAVTDYESNKRILTQKKQLSKQKKGVQEPLPEGGDCEDERELMDEVQATWQLLPQFMPVLMATFENKKQYLSERELFELRDIALFYKEIRLCIRQKLESTLLYNSLNCPDNVFLGGIYPKNILDDIPEWMSKKIASIESSSAIERLVDVIMSNNILLEQYMIGYDISINGLNSYKNPFNEDNHNYSQQEGYEEDSYCSEEEADEDEESFKARTTAFLKQTEEDRIPFVSWHISYCCDQIAKDIVELKKSIIKKPYYGIELRYYRG